MCWLFHSAREIITIFNMILRLWLLSPFSYKMPLANTNKQIHHFLFLFFFILYMFIVCLMSPLHFLAYQLNSHVFYECKLKENYKWCLYNTMAPTYACPKVKPQGLYEPRHEKTGLRCFRPGPTLTSLYNRTRWLEA